MRRAIDRDKVGTISKAIEGAPIGRFSCLVALTIACSPPPTRPELHCDAVESTFEALAEARLSRPLQPITYLQAPTNSSIVTVYDLSASGSNNNRALLSVRHAYDAFGIPYLVTSQLEHATLASELLVVAGRLEAMPLGQQAVTAATLSTWLGQGSNRSLWVFASERSELLELAGISAYSASTARAELRVRPDHDLGAYLDSLEERMLWLPSVSQTEGRGGFVRTLSYVQTQPPSAWTTESVGTFEDSGHAIVVGKHTISGNRLVVFGFDLADMLFRMQYEKYTGHVRGAANTFEITADAVRLMLRAGYERWTRQPFTRPFTPGHRKASVILTHDVDASAAFGPLRKHFLPLERQFGVKSTLNVTTSYRSNGWIGDFFVDPENRGILQTALEQGWRLGSHSVSHLPDMADWTSRKVVTDPGQYAPRFDPATHETTGGSLWAETLLSAAALEWCFGVRVNGWRSGGLASPRDLGDVLDRSGYAYASDVLSGPVGGSFPFLMIRDRSTTGGGEETRVLQLPFSISDSAFANTEDPSAVAELWLDVTHKAAANNAPTILLVHPTKPERYVPAYQRYLEQVVNDPELWVGSLDDWFDWYRGVGIRSEQVATDD